MVEGSEWGGTARALPSEVLCPRASRVHMSELLHACAGFVYHLRAASTLGITMAHQLVAG
eukprot:3775599-Pyramimonas_sp.AAC.1